MGKDRRERRQKGVIGEGQRGEVERGWKYVAFSLQKSCEEGG